MVTHGVIVNTQAVQVTPSTTGRTTIVCIGRSGGGTLGTNQMALLNQANYVGLVGSTGVLNRAYQVVSRQANVNFVAINVPDNPAGVLAGIGYLDDVESRLSTPGNAVSPDLVIMPGYGSLPGGVTDAQCTALAAKCRELECYGIVECTFDSITNASTWSSNNGANRIIGVTPNITVFGLPDASGAALLAGAIAHQDIVVGRQASSSNILLPDVHYNANTPGIGVPYRNATSGAAILDAAHIHSFVQRNGSSYTWGGTTRYNPSTDPRRFVGVGRISDEIIKQLIFIGLSFSGRGIVSDLIQRFTSVVEDMLSVMESRGKIIQGKIYPTPNENTENSLAEGKLYFNIEFTPVYPIRLITYNLSLTNDGLVEVLGG